MDGNQRAALIASACLVAAMVFLSAWAWLAIPNGQPIPVHWGLNGRPDRYGGKAEALLVTPVLAMLVTMVLAVIPRIEPRKGNLIASGRAYAVIWIAIVAFLAVIHGVLVLTAMGAPIEMLVVMPAGIGVLFIIIGFELKNTRSNFFIGIRTPWTLSSELSWQSTHRLGSLLFIIAGILLFLAAMLRSQVLVLALLLAGLPLMLVVLALYSYLVWKNDPNRTGVSS